MEEKNKHPLDWNGKLVRFFYENSRLVWLIIIGIIIGGSFSLVSLKKEGFPAVAINTVAVQTIYPGATSAEVESKVTKEIESSIKDAKGIKDFSSVSQNSFSQVVINFDESVNVDQAVQDVQNKISSAKGNLPKEVEQPKVITWNTGGPAFIFAVSDGNDFAATQKETEKLADEIETVSGVKKVTFDQPENKVIVSLDSTKLQKLSIPLSTISQLLQAGNVNFPIGYLEINNKRQSAITLGAFSSIDDISNIIVGFDPALKKPVYLKDVATVANKSEQKYETINRIGYLDNDKLVSNPGSLLQVELTSDADIIKTKDKILSHIDQIKSDNKISKNLIIKPVYDQAQQTSDQIKEISDASIGSKKNLFLLGGIQLLFIAMLLLVNWRAALISALSIPLAFGFTFIILALTGTELNTLVLFSLVLVLGLVVDPAIVMIEAIQRYRDLNHPSKEAVVESGRRYGASLFMAVLTSLLVFLPFGVVSGFFGQIIKFIPLTVIPALLASYFIPMALLPSLTKKLLKKNKNDEDLAVFGEEENLSKAANFVMRVNGWILKNFWHKALVVVISIILIAGSISIVATGRIQVVQFSTADDNAMLQAQATYKKGNTFATRDEYAKNFEKLILREKSIKEYYYIQQTADGFSMYINLKDKSERKEKSEKSKEVAKRIKADLGTLEGFDDLTVDETSMGPPVGGFQINTQLASNDLGKLESAAKNVGKYLSTLEHVVKVNDGFSGKADPEIEIKLDRAKIDQAGLSSAEVGMQLKSLIDESQAGKINNSDGSSSEISLSISNKPKSIDEVKKMPLLSRNGTVTTVGDVATVSEGEGVSSIERYNGLRFASVQARVDDTKNTMAVQKELDNYLTSEKLKELGVDSKLNKGDIGDMAKSFTELGIALVVAIVLTYIVLVLQFKSFSLPLIMLYTIPLSLIGVFPALWLAKSQFGFLELLGITILVGIVENVAIFLIDYANQLVKEKGMTPQEAIIKASGVRFRPILLTKLVALGGLLPLAIESPFWRGLSIVIIAGIGLSGFFSLVLVPVLYVGIMKARSKIHRGAL